MLELTAEQQAEYRERGYLLVSGLIPDDVSARAEAAMWRLIGADPRDPASWEGAGGGHAAYADADLVACYTPAVLDAAARVAGDDPATVRAPGKGYAINIFPQSGPWTWPGPHIDHAIKEHGHKTFPRAFRVACMTYLSDVPPQGGGTIVWPGSHSRLEALARSDSERYEFMWALNQDLDKAGLGDPVELTPRRGDVLLYHYLCAHAGSKNVSDRPRLALNAKW